MTGPLIHVGYHKTATSWLQIFLFARTDWASFVPLVGRRQIRKLFVRPHALDFDPSHVRSTLAPALHQIGAEPVVPVVSHERLSGNPHTGGYDSKELATRLAQVFPDGKVLLVIREQRELIAATYKQYVKIGGTADLADYLRPRHRERAKIPVFSLDQFRYHRLIECYHDRFGRDGVMVLPYEVLRERPRDFIARIADFAGAVIQSEHVPFSEQPNRSLSALGTTVLRRFNVWARGGRQTPWSVAPRLWLRSIGIAAARRADCLAPARLRSCADASMFEQIEELTDGRYAESNRLTAGLTGLELERYGYRV